MPPNAALSGLLLSEEREHLWSRRVLGVSVWPLERLHAYRSLLLEKDRSGSEESRTNPIDNLVKRSRASVGDLLSGSSVARAGRDIWVLSASNYRRKDAEGNFQCVFAEHLRRELGERLLFIERNQAGLPAQRRDDVVFIDAPLIGAEAMGRALGPLLARSPFGAEAERAGSVRADVLCRDAVYARLLLTWARAWVKRNRPGAVFVLNAYHLFIPFQIAVREAGIPLIELQHGVIHESHPGYVFGAAPEQPHFPDHLVVFGRHFGELLERESPRWKGRWSVGGHPWLRDKSAGLAELPASHFDSIVLFSQHDAPVRQSLRVLSAELRRRVPAHVRIILKPHPREIDASEFYRSASDAGVIVATHQDDTYELLRRCRVAVTVYSTVAIEALAFRCRSVVIRSPFWNEDLRALADAGVLSVADGVDDIARLAPLSPPDAGDGALSRRLFGIGEPDLNFSHLIDTLSASVAKPKPRV